MRYGRELGLIPDGVWEDFSGTGRSGSPRSMAYPEKEPASGLRSGDRVSRYEYLKKPEIGLKDVLEYGQFPFELSDEETRYDRIGSQI
ncbi:MAG: hypothetical protein MZU79_05395 [Anaerotruncus sp.]|nr:hypothetical protein [Anaerotruncus sp.]